MGNANNKGPIPPPSSKSAPEGMVDRLQEDVTCSICLDILEDPVSIECGHNFCRGCLAAHWSGVSAWGYQCPECRAPCSRNRTTPDTRLKSLVEKIRDLPREGTLTGTGTASPEPGPRAQPGPGRPVQLVHLDKEGGLTLDKEALSRCLEQGGVGDAPVCLVSIVGEQRRGKSFLLNYLLRRLQSLDVKDGSWMGREEEPLEGFEWRVGARSVTKGVWAWSQPFWVPSEEGQVAVLLVDTEGSMDIARDTETSVKLSALSMLLGSYQILNVSSQLKDPDLEYLEMFLHVAEEVGKEYGLESIQQLDLLVRDWSNSPVFGMDGGKEHLRDVRQMLAVRSPCKHPKALEALNRSKTRCYLMPFPGKRIMTGSEGCVRDMDEDFRDSLRDYITGLVASAGHNIWRDRHGVLVTGSQLAAKIKEFSDLMKKHCFGFSSPTQMAITFHNQRVLDRASTDHTVFLREKMFLHVAEEVGKEYGLESIQHLDLLVRDWSSSLVLGTDGGKEHLRDVQQMLAVRSPCKHPKALEALNRSKTRCYLMPFPGKRIMTGSEGCVRDMDEDFRDSLRDYITGLVASAGHNIWRDRHGVLVTGSQLAAKIKEFSDLMKKHCFGFSSPTQMAITFHNQRVLDRASTDHTVFLREKDGDSRNMVACLKVRPNKMAELFAERRGQLLWRCRTDMREPAPEKEAQLTELEAVLTREAETFLESYGKRFKKFAILVGVSVGALALGPVGGAAGAGIAAAVIAAEAAGVLAVAEVVAIGVGAGAVAGMCVGGGVGGGVGGNIAQKDRQRAKAPGGRREEEDGTEDLSDEKPLI
ncbi:RING finger protein 112-like [Lepidochelys kempii]|uniref:RING finger protein 112-like n=1 Tax=Lepidochelys kempii TaxID=8472 RepID=UPI003C6F3B28